MFGKHQESMCKSLGNKKLFFVFCRQYNTKPLSIGFRIFTKVYRHIKNFSAHNTDKLILRIINLEMQSTKYPFM